MNINFEAAIKFINLGDNDSAINELNTAIGVEEKNGRESTAIQYRCVLGELLHELGRDDDASKELEKVVKYCGETNSLPQQERIASDILDAIGGKVTLTAMPLDDSADVSKPAAPKKVSRRKKQ